MTDNEILKAWECCDLPYHKDCRHCPARYEGDFCIKRLRKATIDLINRILKEVGGEKQ